MTQVLLSGQSLAWPHDLNITSLAPILGNQVIDATGEKIAFSGYFWTPSRTAKSIRNIGFRLGTVVKAGGSGLTVSLQNVVTSGDMPIPDEVQDETVAIANGDSGFVSNTWYTTGNLSSDRSVNPGDLLAVVIEYDGSGRLGSDSVTVQSLSNAANDVGYGIPATSLKTAAWVTNQRLVPNVVFTCSDGSLATFKQATPFNTITTVAINTGTTPDEVAVKFQMPFACKIDGFFSKVYVLANTRDYDLVLYDDSDTVLASVSIDATTVISNDRGRAWIQLPAEVALSANTTYRLAVKPTTASSINIFTLEVDSASHLDLHHGGQQACYSSRTDGGSWSDTAARRIIGLGVTISSLDDGAGGASNLIVIEG